MCLTIHPKHKHFGLYIAKRAKRDIVVYKILSVIDDTSDCREYHYKKGYNYPEKRGSIIQTNSEIGEGFLHALTVVPPALHNYLSQYEKVVKMVIPKGAWYFLGSSVYLVLGAQDICATCLKYE